MAAVGWARRAASAAVASVGSESRKGAGGGAPVARRAASASACVVRPSARLAEMAASRAEAIALAPARSIALRAASCAWMCEPAPERASEIVVHTMAGSPETAAVGGGVDQRGVQIAGAGRRPGEPEDERGFGAGVDGGLPGGAGAGRIGERLEERAEGSGGTLCGILDEERSMCESLHFRHIREERERGHTDPQCGPRFPEPNPNLPGPPVFR